MNYESCPVCSGTGRTLMPFGRGGYSCVNCQGAGRLPTEEVDDTPILTEDEIKSLLAGAPNGPWTWSIYKGRHPARLCTEAQSISGNGTYLLQLDKDTINGKLADLIEAAPLLAQECLRLHRKLREIQK